MKKFLAVIAVLLLCVSLCEARSKFVEFPTVGVCTGSYVRYRANPDTESDIWGRLNVDDKVIIDGQTVVDGELWYEILPSNAQDSAFVFGKYIVPYYDEEIQQSEIGKFIIKILLTYAPYKDNDYYDEYESGPEVKRRYDEKGWLVRVEAWKTGCSFGDVKIGDNVSVLSDKLGEPDSMSDSAWRYIAGSSTLLTFNIKDGKIVRMIYEE